MNRRSLFKRAAALLGGLGLGWKPGDVEAPTEQVVRGFHGNPSEPPAMYVLRSTGPNEVIGPISGPRMWLYPDRIDDDYTYRNMVVDIRDLDIADGCSLTLIDCGVMGWDTWIKGGGYREHSRLKMQKCRVYP